MKKEIMTMLYNILGQLIVGYMAQIPFDRRREISKIFAEFQEWVYFELVNSERQA